MKRNYFTHTISALLIVICFVFTATQLSAQVTIVETQEKKVNFQVRGGLTLSNLTASWGNSRDDATTIAGFNVGAIADFSLSRDIYLQTGLAFISKGAKVKDVSVDDQYMDATMRAQYLQIPVYIAYKLNIMQSSNKLGFAVGPYFAYGVAGKTSFSQRGSNVDFSINTFDSDGLWNRPDVGLGFELQLELEKVIFLMGSEMGLTKAWKSSALTDSGLHVRNTAVHLSVGFKF